MLREGTKVYFGSYGDFDDVTIYEIVEVNESNHLYTLKNNNGNTFIAAEGEVFPLSKNNIF